METLGIDLASFSGTTGMCKVVWFDTGDVSVHPPENPKDDEAILDAARGVLQSGSGYVAIDAPFGFPSAFSESVALWDQTSEVKAFGPVTDAECCRICDRGWDPLTRRVTDVVVHRRLRKQGLTVKRKSTWPLSSVVERITPSVLRCARLLSQLSPNGVDRTGGQRIVEAYPAAALPTFGLKRPDYKTKKGRSGRQGLVKLIEAGLGCPLPDSPLWLDGDDALDALLCAFVARAAAIGRTVIPEDDEQRAAARREGWIHLPLRETAIKDLRAQAHE